jgi:hypothetical protein
MAKGTARDLNARLARLEAAAAGAGCAHVFTHHSADEFQNPLIGDYKRGHAPKQAGIFAGALVLLAALFILF